MVDDMLLDPTISQQYKIIVYENERKSNLIVAMDVIDYIKTLDKEADGLEEIVVFGFSAGGILASHVMHDLKDLSCYKKLITYDTPIQIIDVMRSFSESRLLRMDMLYYYMVILQVYKNHYNADDIIPVLPKKYRGFDNTLDLIQKIHGFTRGELMFKTQFQFDQAPDVDIVNIYCKHDPIIDRMLVRSRECGVNDSRMLNIEKDMVGHCTDMMYGREYFKHIIRAISYRKIN